MTRLVTRALVLAPALLPAVAHGHPGHGTPHLLHEGDAALGWWLFAAAAVTACAAWWVGRRRS